MTRVWLAMVGIMAVALLVARVQYMELGRELAETKAAHAMEMQAISDAALSAQQDAARARDEAARVIAELDARHHQALRERDDAIDRLMADVAAGRQRLLVAARCAAGAGGVSDSSSASGMDDGARAELDSSARPAYQALRRGIERCTEQLSALQEYVLAVRR